MSKRNIVITIGRQYGSGGREFGRRLAKKLGFAYYDKELLALAAEKAGVNPKFFERNDEKTPKFLSGLFAFTHGLQTYNVFTGSSSISDDSIYRCQSEYIEQLAQQGSCVIVGRTADYLLRNHPRLVNIFVTSDADDCISRVAQRESLSPEKALDKIRRTNTERSRYYNFYTDKTWGAAESYHLCINTSTLPMDQFVDLVAQYINCRFPAQQPDA